MGMEDAMKDHEEFCDDECKATHAAFVAQQEARRTQREADVTCSGGIALPRIGASES